jgi:hypothetical protein
MKRFIIILSICFTGTALYGQSLERQVIGSAGLSVNNSTADLSFTVGEVATASTITGTATLTQGFQQANEEDFTGVIDVGSLNASAIVFPNPTVDVLQIESTLPSMGITTLDYKVLDLQGRLVLQGTIASHEGQLDVMALAASSYTLILTSTDKQFTQRVKFSKI